MKKISYYAVLTVIFFVFLSCKTGDINMPKTSKSASSSAKIDQIEVSSEKDIAKKPEPQIIAETDQQNKENTSNQTETVLTKTEEFPDEMKLETTEPEKEKELF